MASCAQTSSGEVLEPWSPPETRLLSTFKTNAAACQKWKQHAHVLPIRDAARPIPITPPLDISMIEKQPEGSDSRQP